MRFGNQVVMAGTRMITTSSTDIARNKYIDSLKYTGMVVLKNEQTISITIPMGGVSRPRVSVSTMTMPKWIGSIPAAPATGTSMVVSSRMRTVESMNIPAMRSAVTRMNMMPAG